MTHLQPPTTDRLADEVAGGMLRNEGRGTLKRARNALIGIILVSIFALATVVSYSEAFGHPQLNGLPIAVAGNSNVILKLEQQKALQLTVVGTAAAARRDVTDRSADAGYFIPAVPGGTVQVTVASGASIAIAKFAGVVGAKIAAPLHAKVVVADVAPPTGDNPNGSIEFYTILFLTMGAGIGATVFGRLLGTMRSSLEFLERTAVLIVFSAVLSAATTVYLNNIHQAVTPGHGWAIFGAIFLYIMAVSGLVTGAGTLAGTLASISFSAYFLVIGNAASGGPVGWPLQSGFFQVMRWVVPQSYGIDLIHSIEYFNDHGATGPILALAVIGVLGLTCTFVGMLAHAARQAPAITTQGPPTAPPPAASEEMYAETAYNSRPAALAIRPGQPLLSSAEPVSESNPQL